MGRLAQIRAALHPASRGNGAPHPFFARFRSTPSHPMDMRPLTATPDPASALGQIPSIQTPGAEGGIPNLMGFSTDELARKPLLRAFMAGVTNPDRLSPSRTSRAFALAGVAAAVTTIGVLAVMTPGSTMSLMLASSVVSLGTGALSLKVKDETRRTLLRVVPSVVGLGVMAYAVATGSALLASSNALVMTGAIAGLGLKNAWMFGRRIKNAFRNQRTLPLYERKKPWDIFATTVASQSAILFSEIYFFYRTYFTFIASPTDQNLALWQNQFGFWGMVGGFMVGKWWDSHSAGRYRDGHAFSMRGVVGGMAGLTLGSLLTTQWNLIDALSFPMMLFVWWGDLHATHGIGYNKHQILALSPPKNTPRPSFEERVDATRHDAGKTFWEKPTTVPHEWVLPTYFSEVLPGYITPAIGNYTEAVVQFDLSPYEGTGNQKKIETGQAYMNWIRPRVRKLYDIVMKRYREAEPALKGGAGNITAEYGRYAVMLEELAAHYEREAGKGERGKPRGVVGEALAMFNRDIVKNNWGLPEEWGEKHDRYCDLLSYKAKTLRSQAEEIRNQIHALSPEARRCLDAKSLRDLYLRFLNQYRWDLTFFPRKMDRGYTKERSKEPNQMKSREQMGLMVFSITTRDKRNGELYHEMVPATTVRRRNIDWDHIDPAGEYTFSPLEDADPRYREIAEKISRSEHFKYILTDDQGKPIAIQLKNGKIVSWPGGSGIADMTVEAFNGAGHPVEVLAVGQLGTDQPIWVTPEKIAKGFYATGIGMALDDHQWEVNYDAEHTMLRHFEESFPILEQDREQSHLKVTWFEEVDVETPYGGTHLQPVANTKPKKIDFVWAPFEIRFRRKNNPNVEEVIPFGIEKFHVSVFNKQTEKWEAWNRDKMLMGIEKVRSVIPVEHPTKDGFMVRGLRFIFEDGTPEGTKAEFVKDGNEKEPAWPRNLPFPEELGNIHLVMRPERQGVLPFVRYEYADEKTDEKTVRWVKWFDHEERPFPEFDPHALDYDSMTFDGEGTSRRLRFKARRWRGRMVPWDNDLLDTRGELGRNVRVQSVKKWEGKKRVVGLRVKGEESPRFVETDAKLPKADFIDVSDGALVFHEIAQEGILTPIQADIPPLFMEHLDFVYMQDPRTLIAYFRNRKTHQAWRQVIPLSGKDNIRGMYQDPNFNPKTVEDLFPNIDQKGKTPKTLNDGEWDRAEEVKESLGPHHVRLGTYDTFQVGGILSQRESARHDFRLHKELYLKWTETKAESRAIAELTAEVKAALPADLHQLEYITHFKPRSAVTVRNTQTGESVEIPIATRLGPITQVVTEETADQAFHGTQELSEKIRNRRTSGFRDGKIILHVFPQHMIQGPESGWPDIYGEVDQLKFYSTSIWDGFWSGHEPGRYARFMRGTGGNIQIGKCALECVINSGTPVTRVVPKMFEEIVEKLEAEHPGGTFFMTYPEPGDITEDFKESRLVYIQDGYVSIYTPKVVAVAEGVNIAQIFVQRRRWSSSVAIGKIWIRPFVREQIRARVAQALGREPRTPVTYSGNQLFEEVLGCTWYMVGPAALSRLLAPAGYQFAGLNPFMAEGSLYPFLWLPQFASSYMSYWHSAKKAGINTVDALLRDPAIFYTQVPMFMEMLGHIDDEHKGPFAVSALSGNTVARRYLGFIFGLAVLNAFAGMRGVRNITEGYALSRDRYDFGNFMNTIWPLYNAALIAWGLKMIFQGQSRVYREDNRQHTQLNDKRHFDQMEAMRTFMAPHLGQDGRPAPTYVDRAVLKAHLAQLKKVYDATIKLEINVKRISKDRRDKKNRLKRLFRIGPKDYDDTPLARKIKKAEEGLDTASDADLPNVAVQLLELHNSVMGEAHDLRRRYAHRRDGSHFTRLSYWTEELLGFMADIPIDAVTETPRLIRKWRKW